jgi:hypothetical protein
MSVARFKGFTLVYSHMASDNHWEWESHSTALDNKTEVMPSEQEQQYENHDIGPNDHIGTVWSNGTSPSEDPGDDPDCHNDPKQQANWH